MFDSPITRREALRRIYRAIVATGAASFLGFDDLLAADRMPAERKPHLLWLHGSSCSGCSVSFLDIEQVPVLDILTRFTNLVFHPDVSLATGDQVTDLLARLEASKLPYILVVEGGVPVGMPHACLMAGKPFVEWLRPLAAGAEACIAAGTCAALGGIPKMNGTLTGSQTLGEFLANEGIEVPLASLPNCPMKPEHFVYAVLHYALSGHFPERDAQGRPLRFFGHTNHERCIYYADFQEKHFARHIGDEGCLLKLGCQGPVTKSDCLVTGHNGNTNTCIRAGHPCVGCAGERFPRQIMLHTYRDRRSIRREF